MRGPYGPTHQDLQLTETERAYRRGALQAVQYLMRSLHSNPIYRADGTPSWLDYEVLRRMTAWELALIAARDDPDPKWLGKYLDEIRDSLPKV